MESRMQNPGGRAGAAPAKRRWRQFLCALCLLLLGAFLALRLVLVPYRIVGDSMVPTLRGRGVDQGGDLVLVSRLSYAWGDPCRWDVVVVESADAGKGDAPNEAVKRIVGLPGESVEIVAGSLYVDGRRLEPPEHLRGIHVVGKGPFGHRPIRLGKDEYFLLGDNSYLSNDSRALGPVERRKLSGKVVFRFAPLDRLGPIR